MRPDVEVFVPVHDGVTGHPIVLRSTVFDAVRALGDDAPLRDLLHTRSRLLVHVDDAGVTTDVDTPGDLDLARSTLGDR
jgi:molybdenum cofactor cytidylyltransferase